MTLAEQEELAALRRYDELCSLGDRPMSRTWERMPDGTWQQRK